MRRLALLLVLIGVGSIAASLALVPGATELAIMRWKDGDLAEARSTLEGRWQAGDLAAGDVLPLVDIYVQTGAVGQAILLLESWARRHPAEIAVRRKLGELYRDALRLGDYDRNLEALLALDPDESVLRELASRLDFVNDQAARKRILGALGKRDPEGGTADLEELAGLLAAEGRPAEATRELLPREEHLSARGQGLLLNLLLDLGQDRKAEAVAVAWLEREPAGEELDRLVAAVQETSGGRLAVSLLDRWHDRLPPSDARLIHYADLLTAHKREGEARRRLEARLDAERPIDPALVSAALQAALAAGLADRARAQALSQPAELLSDRLLASLLDEALSAGDRAYGDRLVAHAGMGFLDDSPLVAAAWAVDRQDWAAARSWLSRIEAAADLEEPDILRLAELYEVTQEIDRGRRFMERLRHDRPGAASETAWALLGMAGGNADAVRAWLPNASSLPPEMLAQLTRMATGKGIGDLALALANQLVAKAETPKTPTLQRLQRPLAIETSMIHGEHGGY